MNTAKTTGDAIGMIEVTSVGLGHLAQDAMLKAAEVRLLLGRTICSGKYIVVVGGNVSNVQASVKAGIDILPDGLIDHIMIPNIHAEVFKALGDMVQLNVKETNIPALGIVETFSASSSIEAADVAAKAANVTLFRIHLAMALGGKGFVMMSGDVADVRAAVDAAKESVKEKGLLVSAVVIPRPSRELFSERL